MAGNSSHAEPGRAKRWTGYVLSAFPVLLMGMSAVMKITRQPVVIEGFARTGLPAAAVIAIGVVELLCVLLYVVPVTAVLGAILSTGYLGGAVMVHVRAQELHALTPFLLGVVAWIALGLREPRLRALLPLRKRTVARDRRSVNGGYPRAETSSQV